MSVHIIEDDVNVKIHIINADYLSKINSIKIKNSLKIDAHYKI